MKKLLLAGVLLAGMSVNLNAGEHEDIIKACEINGNAGRCLRLGWNYEGAVGVKQDYSKAFYYFGKACDRGNVLGCFGVGRMYAKGQGVLQDEVKAVEFFRKSCNDGAGSTVACFRLGEAFYKGQGVKKNWIKARSYFGISCDTGYPEGCENYAILKKK